MLDSLVLKGKEDSPAVEFNAEKNIFEISGRSLPENANTIYNPILTWLKLYFENPNPETILDLKLEYLNSSSSKKIIELLLLFENQMNQGKVLRINWFYKTDDLTMETKGIELLSIFHVPFEMRSY